MEIKLKCTYEKWRKTKMIDEIRKVGIVPVVVIDDAKDALPLAKALIDGGINCAEVTFRTAAAKDAIKIISEAYPNMLVGAGTVLTKEQVDDAVMAGAKFLVSPGLNPRTVQYAMDKGVTMIPGVCTPSDIERGLELGLKVMKFFPAEPSGGITMIKALAAPYTDVLFMPTGGISKDNIEKYLEFNRVIACGGSWMVSKDMIKSGDFARITELSREAMDIVRKVRG
ncbi:MAG: bifunctional 4-hydroxy-2-oxoglutarate aldolase/2-dehydro-3-deoxy-phosphogluconate aldolase [Lachnospiraceae bacterium]|nr:bifunctional 4-hydroxy-2-oxoglutarate aldolase/2-dehydro-3-deoxy-phosphogluconate aldolase [Lachnospiraceae bacterium]